MNSEGLTLTYRVVLRIQKMSDRAQPVLATIRTGSGGLNSSSRAGIVRERSRQFFVEVGEWWREDKT